MNDFFNCLLEGSNEQLELTMKECEVINMGACPAQQTSWIAEHVYFCVCPILMAWCACPAHGAVIAFKLQYPITLPGTDAAMNCRTACS
jgi:hypothetical protein